MAPGTIPIQGKDSEMNPLVWTFEPKSAIWLMRLQSISFFARISLYHFEAYRYDFVLTREAEHDLYFWEIESFYVFIIQGG